MNISRTIDGLSGAVLLSLALAGVACTSAPVEKGSAGAKLSTPVAEPPSAGCGDPSDPGACTWEVLGDGSTCLDPASVKQQASDACAAQGATLVSLTPVADCANGGSTVTDYECCVSPQVPPDPCTWNVLGDGSTCLDPAAVNQQAADACAAQGATLSDVFPAADCAGGGSTVAKYACCAAANP